MGWFGIEPYTSRYQALVKTGPLFGDRVEILSGLSAGDTILIQPVKG